MKKEKAGWFFPRPKVEGEEKNDGKGKTPKIG